MIAFTRSIAAELAPQIIIANCDSPGWVDTDMTSHILHNRTHIKSINRAIPRGRAGTPDEIARAVLFLESNLSNHIVGAVISVNSGSVLFG